MNPIAPLYRLDVAFVRHHYDFIEKDIENIFGTYLTKDQALRMAAHGMLPKERLAENLSASLLQIALTLSPSLDLANGDDVKTTSDNCRERGGSDHNTYHIKGIGNKTGWLICFCYNEQRDEFDYFYIPYYAYQDCLKSGVEIGLSVSTGEVITTRKFHKFYHTSIEKLLEAVANRDKKPDPVPANKYGVGWPILNKVRWEILNELREENAMPSLPPLTKDQLVDPTLFSNLFTD